MQSNLFLLTAPDVCGWGIAEGSFFIIGRKIVFTVEIAGDGGSVSVSVIFEDSSGKFWIGTHDDGVYVCDQQMQVISHYSQRTNLALSDNAVSSIYEDHLKQIWVGCHLYGLYCVDLRNNRITHYIK